MAAEERNEIARRCLNRLDYDGAEKYILETEKAIDAMATTWVCWQNLQKQIKAKLQETLNGEDPTDYNYDGDETFFL
jgi:hypothetical protein